LNLHINTPPQVFWPEIESGVEKIQSPIAIKTPKTKTIGDNGRTNPLCGFICVWQTPNATRQITAHQKVFSLSSVTYRSG
jgi:hypothetical protein